MSIHSIAIHHRAAEARARAKTAAVVLVGELLEWLATDCPADTAQPVATAITQVQQYSETSPHNFAWLPAFSHAICRYSNSARKAHAEFNTLRSAAVELTAAAQTVEYRP